MFVQCVDSGDHSRGRRVDMHKTTPLGTVNVESLRQIDLKKTWIIILVQRVDHLWQLFSHLGDTGY